jgi:hypothetical protein
MSKHDVDQERLLKACRRLVALNDDPHPGLATWNLACVEAVREIRESLGDGNAAQRSREVERVSYERVVYERVLVDGEMILVPVPKRAFR